MYLPVVLAARIPLIVVSQSTSREMGLAMVTPANRDAKTSCMASILLVCLVAAMKEGVRKGGGKDEC